MSYVPEPYCRVEEPVRVDLYDCVKRRALPSGLTISELRDAITIALEMRPVADKETLAAINEQITWETSLAYIDALSMMGITVV